MAKYLYDTGSPSAISPKLLAEWVAKEINKEKILEVEYIEIVDAASLEVLNNWSDAEHIQLCAAVFAHPVRLIDNIKLK
jgi:pantoate--beta-alanine ligase